MQEATYTGLDGEEIKETYDADAPCICCGLPVVAASMGGTVVCPWCDMGILRDGSGDKVIRKHGPHDPHPEYIEFYKIGEPASPFGQKGLR